MNFSFILLFTWAWANAMADTLEHLVGYKKMGMMTLTSLRVPDRYNNSSCDLPPETFLAIHFDHKNEGFSPQQIAEFWIAEYENGNFLHIFWGYQHVFKVYHNMQTLNLLVDSQLQVNRYWLQNNTNGDQFRMFTTEEKLFQLFASCKMYAAVEVLECRHMLHALAKNIGSVRTSITVIDRSNSKAEREICEHFGGIVGFYSFIK